METRLDPVDRIPDQTRIEADNPTQTDPIWLTDRWPDLLLWCVEKIGPVRHRSLVEHFGHARAAMEAGPTRCAEALQRPHLIESFSRTWTLGPRETDLKRFLSLSKVSVIAHGDPEFPPLLAASCSIPWLFVRGDLTTLSSPLAAIVGTRSVGFEALRLTRRVVGWCIKRGFNTVSGGALGVDGEVHRSSIDLDVPTVVVQPAGLNHLAPASHRHLFEEVVENGGCLISEHPPWRYPRSELFVRRNRLISGLAAFTVVVRAPRRSGALVTADWARRQNRPVFAVPGSPLDPTSAGCLEAIRRGAGLLTTAGDLPRYGAAIPSPSCTAEVAPHQSRQGQLSEIQQAVLRGLGSHPQTLEGLVSKLGRDPQKILVALTELLLSGHIAQTGPGVYQVTRPS